MRKILMSLSVIAFVAAIAIVGTTAYFSDVEKSSGNTFTAGTIDIVLDDANEVFCNIITDQGVCEEDSRCIWNENKCEQRKWKHGVTGTWDTPENWNPGKLWNAWISIHNNGNKDIEQILFSASAINDDLEGLNPESEPNNDAGTGGGDRMADDIYFWGAEEFVWPSETYQDNKLSEPGDGRWQAIWDFNTKWGTDIDEEEDGAVDAFNKALEKLGLGNNDLRPVEAQDIVKLINFAYQVDLTFKDFGQNSFVKAFDKDGNGKADLDEFYQWSPEQQGFCSKNVLFRGEILEPCAVKILVIHWMFDIDAHNNLQGDKVKVDFTFNAIQDGVAPQEILCGIN